MLGCQIAFFLQDNDVTVLHVQYILSFYILFILYNTLSLSHVELPCRCTMLDRESSDHSFLFITVSRLRSLILMIVKTVLRLHDLYMSQWNKITLKSSKRPLL